MVSGHYLRQYGRVILLGVMIAVGRLSTAYADADDAYLKGYADAVLVHNFSLTTPSVTVQNGVVRVYSQDLGGANHTEVTRALSDIPGVQGVEIRDRENPDTPIVTATAPPPPVPLTHSRPTEASFLPPGSLFPPLLADPRWPDFSIAYRYYIEDNEVRHVGSANFGGMIALYRDTAPLSGQWEAGLQAGVFSIFDLAADSKDLVNSDFFVAGTGSYRKDNFSAMARLFHQSSHLGDEFLLRNRVNRINLSYESLDLKLSYRIAQMFQLYVGGGWLFDQEPADLDPWMTQFGLDFESPWLFFGHAQPIGGADFKLHEEHAWSTDFSIRAGVRFSGSRAFYRKVALMLEYFKGHSPNGQFYQRKIEYIGLGLHYYF